MRTFFISLSALVIVLNTVHGEKTEPGLFTSQAIGASYNPLGLLVDSKLLYTTRLFQKSGILWESTKLRIGLQNELTPADNLFLLRTECEPIAFFDINFKCGIYSMFNKLGYGCYRMTTSTGPYDLKTQNRHELANAQGYWISISPTLKAKFDKIIFLNTTTINSISIDESAYFLEIRSYLPHKTRDVDLVNGTFLLYEYRPTLLIGVSLKNAYVYGTSLFSQMLSGMVVIKSAPSSPKKQFLVLTTGLYLKDPLFAKSLYCACLAGRDFKLR
jgi:hypothetical protein